MSTITHTVYQQNVNPLTAESMMPGLYEEHFLFTGLVRNCGNGIRENVMHMANVLRNFSNVHWLIIESDSSDNTLAELARLQAEIRNFRFITLGELSARIPQRTARIAYCRNKYLDELRTNPKYSGVRFLVVADLDGVNAELTDKAFVSCWRRDDWSVCAANQRGPYYDIFALRHPLWCPVDSLKQQQFLEPYVGYEDALRRSVKARMIPIPETADWIEVDSAFGGMAIYKREAVHQANYSGLDQEGNEVCEHVAFHEGIRACGFRLFINPSFINAGYTEHSARYRFYPSVIRGAINLLKGCIRKRI